MNSRAMLSAILSIVWVALAAFQARAESRVVSLSPGKPRYELVLTYEEYGFIHEAARAGVKKYGGAADFGVKLINTSLGVVWVVSSRDPEFMGMLELWTQERLASLASAADFRAGLDPATAEDFELAKSALGKLKSARTNPTWDPIHVEGLLARADTTWSVTTDSGSVVVRPTFDRASLPQLIGRPVVVEGAVRQAGQLDALRIFEKRPNTLDLYVMSLCPYAQRAEAEIIEQLSRDSSGAAPKLNVHYIYSGRKEGGATGYASMHGEPELAENLVQMAIRDSYPQAFQRYLVLRAGSTAPWKDLASEAGLSPREIQSCLKQASVARLQMLRSEYEKVAGLNGVRVRSPTFAWEGRLVSDLSQVPYFADRAVGGAEHCENEAMQ